MLRVSNDRSNSKNYQVIFGGLDARRGAGDGTIAAMKNLSSDEYPLVSPRDKRYTVHTFAGNINGYLCHDGHEFVCAGNYLYADGKVYDYNLSSKEKSMAIVSGKLMIWPDKVYFDLTALTSQGAYDSFISLNEALADFPDDDIGGLYMVRRTMTGHYGLYRYSGSRDDNGNRIWTFERDVVKVISYSMGVGSAKFLRYGEIYGEKAENNCLWMPYSYGETMYDLVRVGDAVQISGCTRIPSNNKTAVIRDMKLVENDGLYLYFDENCFEQGASYYTYTADADLNGSSTTGVHLAWTPVFAFFGDGSWRYFELPSNTPKGTKFSWDVTSTKLKMQQPGSDTATEINFLPPLSGNSSYGNLKTLEFQPEIGSGTSESDINLNRIAPDLDAIFEHNNRLWGCKGSEIYCSKLGDPINFYVYEGLSTDAWFVDVGGDGDFTCGCSYLGRPTFFKENAIYKVYGTKPSNFETSDTMTLGVESDSGKSLAIAGETLFYLSRHGVVAYNGGVPSVISAPLGLKKFKNAVGGSDGLKYYVSMTSGSTAGLYVYDTQKRLWHREDDLNADGFGWYEDALRAATKDKKVLTVSRVYDAPINSTAETAVGWELVTNWIVENSPEKKTISKIHIRMDMEAGSSADIYIDYNNGKGWKLVNQLNGKKKTVYTDRLRSFYLPVIPERCDNFRLKMTGTGWFALYSLAIEYYDGSGY